MLNPPQYQTCRHKNTERLLNNTCSFLRLRLIEKESIVVAWFVRYKKKRSEPLGLCGNPRRPSILSTAKRSEKSKVQQKLSKIPELLFLCQIFSYSVQASAYLRIKPHQCSLMPSFAFSIIFGGAKSLYIYHWEFASCRSEFTFKATGLTNETHFASTAALLELAHVVKCWRLLGQLTFCNSWKQLRV